MDFSTRNLAVAELVIFSIALLLSSWHVAKNGINGSTKWPSLILLALLHVIASSYQIGTHGNAGDAVEVFDAVGIFFILLAFIGMLEPL
jgi:hypothetical protein